MNYNSVGVILVVVGWISMALDENVSLTGPSSALKDFLFVLGTVLIFIGLISLNMDNAKLKEYISGGN